MQIEINGQNVAIFFGTKQTDLVLNIKINSVNMKKSFPFFNKENIIFFLEKETFKLCILHKVHASEIKEVTQTFINTLKRISYA